VFVSLPQAPTSHPPVVLVVDDEREVREIEQALLEHAGYRVLVAAGGVAALSLMSGEDRVDIVVADVVMPGMDGTEMVRRLRIGHPDLKVLFVTGYSDRLFEAQPWLWEHVAFLDKPFTGNGLLEAVSTLLSGRVTTTAPHATANQRGHSDACASLRR